MTRIAALLAALALAGTGTGACSSPPPPSSPSDAKAKQFAPEAGKANLYLVREKVAGSTTKLELFLDDKGLGALAPGMYFMVGVAPGKHTLRAESPGAATESGPVDAEAGKNHFIAVSTMCCVWKTEVVVDELSEQDGKREVLDAERAEPLAK